MHLLTTIRITAQTETEALQRVCVLLANKIAPFDYYESDPILSSAIKTDLDWIELICQEKKNSKDYQAKAEEGGGSAMRGFYLQMADECLQPDKFASTERLAYDYDKYELAPLERVGKVFYIEIDRHY